MMEPLLFLWLLDIAVVGGSAAAIYVYNNCTTVSVHSLMEILRALTF